ncbi:MAG: nucleoside hydrolase [Defluviitaleaceae bacterium]|nr:nucleoside hydrolase [Defluviitaleaceae bacterium]
MMKWNYDFEVPEQKKIRMIVHTDCKNEADDQFALAHHVMTPKFIVKGIVGGHFNMYPREYGEGNTAKASVDEINKVLDLMGLNGVYPVLEGAPRALANESTPIQSPAVDFIIEEAMKDDDRPLFISMLGAITDLAAAILLKPEICQKMTAIWIGGGQYPEGEDEFNCKQDIAAANVVMKSEMPLWQVPKNVYKQMAVSLAELQVRVKPYGKIGKYLFEQMVDFNMKTAHIPHWPHGEIWGLGDSPTISVLMEESEKTDIYDLIHAPNIRYDDLKYEHNTVNRKIRVYKAVNVRLCMEDFYAKLMINFPNQDS